MEKGRQNDVRMLVRDDRRQMISKVRCKRSTRSLPVVDRESLATIQGHILNGTVSADASRTVFTQIVFRGDVRGI